ADALPVDPVRHVDRRRIARADPVEQDRRRAGDEVAVADVRLLDLGIHAEVEVIEDPRDAPLERRETDGLVAQSVDEQVEPLLGQDPADVTLEQDLVRPEATRVVPGDPADRIRESDRAMDAEQAVAFRPRTQRANEGARPADPLPGEDVDLMTARQQPVDEMPFALSLHGRPGEMRYPEDPHGV